VGEADGEKQVSLAARIRVNSANIDLPAQQLLRRRAYSVAEAMLTVDQRDRRKIVTQIDEYVSRMSADKSLHPHPTFRVSTTLFVVFPGMDELIELFHKQLQLTSKLERTPFVAAAQALALDIIASSLGLLKSSVGVSHITFITSPPLHLLPGFQEASPVVYQHRLIMEAMVITFNRVIKERAQQLEVEFSNVDIALLDVAASFQMMYDEPTQSGFANRQPCLRSAYRPIPSDACSANQGTCEQIEDQLCVEPSKQMFFDDFHYSTGVHVSLARSVLYHLAPQLENRPQEQILGDV